jgi:dimethylhistidine N-methyltransferase
MDRPLAAVAPLPRAERFTLHRLADERASFADDVREGLTSTPKFLQPQYFYDALGSALFSAICELPEYYVTRSETEILNAHAAEIAAAFGDDVRLAELGSGSARKTSLLIDAVLARQEELEFVAVDVDEGVLESSARDLTARFPRLTVTGVRADFRDPAAALGPFLDDTRRNVVLFLGSSIGNLDRAAAAALLRDLRSILAAGDLLFLGADRKKRREVLEPAYDDALGVTAAFNLNLLARINRELDGDFDISKFAHRALYNESEGRVEMHLVSKESQRAHAAGVEIALAAGESIHTENSYKYDDDDLKALAAAGGFAIERRWSDAREWFTDLLLVAR